jgi:spermidine synthase
MHLTFTEKHTANVGLSIDIDRQLYCAQSAFQRIDVFETPEFGRILALDGILMLTEKDEFIYHEMITHVPMAVHPAAKNVLIIGGGDGGAVRELCRYDTAEHIDLVEIDEAVVQVCREYFPAVAGSLSDPRVRIRYEDGLKYIRRCSDQYDVIIVDSTDPFGPGEGLFTKEFYGNCFKALKEDGILVNQHEDPFYPDDAAAVRRIHKQIVLSFPLSRLYQAHIPTYPSGHWLFGFSSKKYHPVQHLDAQRWNSRGLKTRYYNTNLHKAAFALPTYVEDLIRDVE